MDADPDVRVLRITIENDKVKYIYAKASSTEPNKLDMNWDDGEQPLALDELIYETITTLIDQLTLLSDVLREHPGMSDENILRQRLKNVVKVLGMYLYKVLFQGEKKDQQSNSLEQCLNKALTEAKLELIRIELECKDQNLAVWPWEYLYKPLDVALKYSDDFLVNLAKQLVLNRKLYRVGSADLETTRPVKVLLIVAKPKELGYVDYTPVRDYLQELQQGGIVSLDDTLIEIVPSPPQDKAQMPDYLVQMASYDGPKITRDAFRKKVETFDPHIIHFIGHGNRAERTGRIGLVQEGGAADWVEDTTFAGWLQNCPSLKLVFLQACESALPDPYRTTSGMAMQLAKKDIPAVVAMQYKIDNQTANNFAHGFYRALAVGQSVDLAVRAGREEIKGKDESQIYAFGLPVLYLRGYGRVILPEVQQGSPKSLPKMEYPCPKCEKLYRKGMKFCPSCGASLAPVIVLRTSCPFCDNADFYDPNGKFCPACGKLLTCTGEGCGKRFTDASVEPSRDPKFCKTCWEQQQQNQRSSVESLSIPAHNATVGSLINKP